jgi:hypothetical protein
MRTRVISLISKASTSFGSNFSHLRLKDYVKRSDDLYSCSNEAMSRTAVFGNEKRLKIPRVDKPVQKTPVPHPLLPLTPLTLTLSTVRFERLGCGVKLRGVHGEGSHFERAGPYRMAALPVRHRGGTLVCHPRRLPAQRTTPKHHGARVGGSPPVLRPLPQTPPLAWCLLWSFP